MRHLLSFILSIWLCASLSAQEFEVRSFEADPTDLAARRFPRTTVNDEPAALIKVMTNIEGLNFDSNLGIVDVDRKEDEYWVYVPPRERRIRLMAQGFLSLDLNMPEPAQSHTVYQLVVTRKGMLAPITDLVRLTFRLNESDVFIRRSDQAPVSTIGNIAVFNIEKGEHSFRFIKEGFDEKTLTLDVSDDDDVFVELISGQATTPFEPPGFIIVTSEPSGSEVYLNEQRVGVTPYQNSHISGQYSLMLRNPDYHDHYQTFSLEAGATMTIPTVNLNPRYGFYEVTSTPSGAEILLNNRLVGRTPLPKTQISSEYHELTVRYSMYHDHKETFTIEDGDHKRFDMELTPAFGGLRITSEPSGSKVFVDGREVGVTPYENMQKPSGRYNIRLSLDLYGDATETIVISDGETTERFIPLARNFGSLEVQAADADIYIDGERVGRGSHTADLTPGRYLLKATRPQHHDDEREVFIRLGQTERITLSPAPKTGYVSITSEPFEASGAEIWIDGVRQQQVTPAVIALLEGSYEVRLKKAGFADAVERVQVRERETAQKTIRMYAGMEVTITSEPSGAALFINGQRVGTTPYKSELSFGGHQLRMVNRSRTVEETIQVRQGGRSSFSFDVAECPAEVTFTYNGRRVTYGVIERGGLCWMDRNLGASRVPTSSTDAQGYGDLFQWGRGDDGHQDRASGTISKPSNRDVPGHGDFITGGSSPWDWRSPQNAILWQGEDGINNPCPPGWRLPTEREWRTERKSWGSNNSAGAFASPLKLPAAGLRSYSRGSLYGVSSSGRYWSSTVDVSRSRSLYFDSTVAGTGSDGRAFGYSVRCLKY